MCISPEPETLNLLILVTEEISMAIAFFFLFGMCFVKHGGPQECYSPRCRCARPGAVAFWAVGSSLNSGIRLGPSPSASSLYLYMQWLQKLSEYMYIPSLAKISRTRCLQSSQHCHVMLNSASECGKVPV